MFAASLPWRMPHVDDAWLGEHSYWLANEGVVKSKLMTGIADGDERLVLHHKLHTWIGAAVIKMGGFKLHLLKATSLLFLLLSLWISLHLGSLTGLITEAYQRILLVLIILANPLIFEFGFVFRPEMLLATLVLLSFLFLHKAMVHQATGHINALVAGIFAGMALLGHLNGSVFIAAGFLSLVFMRHYSKAGLFALAALAVSALYLIDFRGPDDFGLWYHQLTFLPNERSHTAWWQKFLLNLRDEHMRYFHSPKEIVFTLLMLFTLLVSGRRLWNKQRLLVIYILTAMFFLGLLALNKTSKYLIPLLPFWSLLIVSALTIPKTNIVRTRWGVGLGALALIVSLGYNASVVVNKYDPRLNQRIREAFSGQKSEFLKVAAPMEFIFDEIDNFESILGLMAWSELQKLNPGLKGQALLKKAAEQDIDLILLNRKNQHTFGMLIYNKGHVCEGYVLMHKSLQLMVWSRVPDNNSLTVTPVIDYREGFIRFNSAMK